MAGEVEGVGELIGNVQPADDVGEGHHLVHSHIVPASLRQECFTVQRCQAIENRSSPRIAMYAVGERERVQ
jgi:hypothetical protein